MRKQTEDSFLAMKSNEITKQSLPNGPTSFWLNKEDFMKDDFNVEHFVVECRRHVTLDVLRNELHLYLKVLQSAMIELINKDYADFLNLSTNLIGMDKAINHLIQPLNSIKSEITSVRKVMLDTINAIEEKIKIRTTVREKKERLLCMMKIIQSLEAMENLLGIIKEEENHEKITKHWEAGNDQLIERVASEFNRLQFYINKSKGIPLVSQIEPRVKVIADTLAFSLEASLKECLTGLDRGDLLSCLRTYASIDKMEQAQSVFRKFVVHDYMLEFINEQNMKEKGLESVFEKILEFIPLHCSRIKAATSGSVNAVLGYDFIVNAVWPEIVSSLEFRMPSLFAPGDPDLFHERYLASMAFLKKFESLLSSQASVKRLRQHHSYISFMSKWSVSVYFQIRFQDIAGQLEVALVEPFSSDANNDYGFTLASNCTLRKCLKKCWSPGVYLDVLLHRFWRLSLQLMSRYGMWIKDFSQELGQTSPNLPRVESASSFQLSHKLHDSADGVISPATSSPSLQSLNLPSQAVHLRTPKDCVALLSDIRKLTKVLQDIYLDDICPLLSKHEGINMDLMNGAWKDAEDFLTERIPEFMQYISNDIAVSCCSHLKNVNNIPRLYKRTNREAPSKASLYMSSLLKPLKEFLEKHSSIITEEDKKSIILRSLHIVTEQFLSVTTEVLMSVRRMEESLKRLKAARGTTSNSGNQGMSDDDKIRSQLSLDVLEYSSQILNLGLNEIEVPSLEKLKEIVMEPLSSS